MKRSQAFIGVPVVAMLALVGMTTFAPAGKAADEQADREARRIENEARRQQEIGRREMENRDRMQADALRSQEEAMRRTEATRSRIEVSTDQIARQSAEQARMSYPYNTLIVPAIPAPLPVVPRGGAPADRARQDDPVNGMSFAPLSARLKSYFGAQSGVLVVTAGAGAPFRLQDGDVIISVDGRIPADDQQLASILRSYRPGESVRLRVQRDRKVIEFVSAAPEQRSN